jgi:hypothetical protein
MRLYNIVVIFICHPRVREDPVNSNSSNQFDALLYSGFSRFLLRSKLRKDKARE